MPYLFAIIFRVAAFLIYTIYITDLYLLRNFNTHLLPKDALQYGSYVGKYLSQAEGKSLTILGLTLCLTIPILLLLFLSPYKLSGKKGYIFSLSPILILGILSLFTAGETYIHSWIYNNVFSYNLVVLSGSKKYSADFKNNFKYKEKFQKTPKENKQPNIIFLMVESLSSYQR